MRKIETIKMRRVVGHNEEEIIPGGSHRRLQIFVNYFARVRVKSRGNILFMYLFIFTKLKEICLFRSRHNL